MKYSRLKGEFYMPDKDLSNYTPELGDIVILHGDNTDSVGMVVGLTEDSTSVYLDSFGIGGMGGTTTPYQRGTGAGQWEPKRMNPQLLP
jgi:hypothetical protein